MVRPISMPIPHEVSSIPVSHQGYDVFLSFRGFDTRGNFTAHLHKALKDAKIKAFYDDDDCETGEPLKPVLENAIKTSRASVIVLSTTYASSTWCLDELALILDQNRSTSHIVIPVFFNVDPTDVRKQKKSFKTAMKKQKKKMARESNAERKIEWGERIRKWQTALTEVSNLKGHHFDKKEGRKETVFIEEVITDILRRLSILLGNNQGDLFGMDDQVDFLSSWLKDRSTHTADIITIYGMDGIGKTSLARYIYLRHCLLFQRNSFIVDIHRTLHDLDEQLFSGISKPSSVPDNDDPCYTSKIEKELQGNKLLLVLDDVDSVDQLDALLGNRGFHPGSKIIITTKDASLTEKCVLFNSRVKPKHTKLLLEGLNRTASLQLLCFHAFMCNSPKEGYEELSEKLVKYCEGHPQALEIFGKDLRGLEVDHWKEKINMWLNKEFFLPLKNIVGRSFESLNSSYDKELFKHIAFFFTGKDRDFAETILRGCNIPIQTGIKNLIDRCLVTIGTRNELRMHQLLQDMGRHEVKNESVIKPWKRSRLWCHKDSFKTLRAKRDKINLLGIIFDQRAFETTNSQQPIELETDDLSRMDNLLLLQLNYVQLNGSYENFPKELRWLCMHGFPSQYIPSDIPMENLVALDLSYSKIKFFDMSFNKQQRSGKTQMLTESHSKEKPLLPSLQILNLSFCRELRRVCGFIELPVLERLILASCKSLTDICRTIEHCDGIVIIDLSYCSMLESLPSTLFKLKNLAALSLEGCNLIEDPIFISYDELLGLRDTKMIPIGSQVSSCNIAEAIPRDIRSFPISLASSLLSENVHNESFPMAFSTRSMSEMLTLDGNPIVFLPNCVRSLRRIELLSLEERDMLKEIKHTSFAQRKLKFSRLELLKIIKDDLGMSSIPIALSIYLFAHSLIEMEGIVKIQPIAQVEEMVIYKLGWNDLDFIKNQVVQTWNDYRTKNRSHVQLFFEFGIFSTYYGGIEIPNWINDHKSSESSISFTLSSTNNLRGLNFCYMQTGQDEFGGANLLTVIVSNITKKRTWIYKPYIHWVKVNKECLIWLSHWMFGKNEMGNGDLVTIRIPQDDASVNVTISECGVSLVYDVGTIEEKDPLGNYKSWNHIIGGDLSAFRLTTGEYFLDNHRFYLWHIDCPINRPFLANGTCYEEAGMYFRKELPHVVPQSVAGPEHEEVAVEDVHIEPNHSFLQNIKRNSISSLQRAFTFFFFKRPEEINKADDSK